MDDEMGGEDLDTLFERYKVSGTAEEKAALAESYLDMFHEMCYDFSCGKLTADGVSLLTSIVENIEILRGDIFWSLRANAYEILMEDAEERNDAVAVIQNGLLSIEASLNQISEGKELSRIHCQKISFCYYTLLSYVSEEKVDYWEKSLYYTKEAILEMPEKAHWTQYFKLIYCYIEKEPSELTSKRREERNVFRHWCLSLKNDGSLSFVIASEFIRFKEFMGYSEADQDTFPEQEYSFWLEKSLSDELVSSADRGISTMGHFYQKEGVRLQRLDLLERALSCFEMLFYEHGESFAVYYTTDVLEKMATLYLMLGLPEKADAMLTKALEWNEGKQEYLDGNFSLLHHYSEFLERCYHYKGNIVKPSLSLVKSVARQAEEEGKGFYSGPYFLQARIALEQRNEHLAMAMVCRALLLHELCIEDRIVQFYKYLPKGIFPVLEKFLATTMLFMKSIREGYFYNPEIRHEALCTMSDEEVIEAWILRKAVLKKSKR